MAEFILLCLLCWCRVDIICFFFKDFYNPSAKYFDLVQNLENIDENRVLSYDLFISLVPAFGCAAIAF